MGGFLKLEGCLVPIVVLLPYHIASECLGGDLHFVTYPHWLCFVENC